MAIEVIQARVCDACLPERTVGQTVWLGTDSGRMRGIELCETHMSMPLNKAMTLASSYGRPASPPPQKTPVSSAAAVRSGQPDALLPGERRGRKRGVHSVNPLRYNYCPLCWKPYSSTTGAAIHLSAEHLHGHHATPTEFLASMVCPLCGDATSTNVRMLGAHLNLQHGATVMGAYRQAREEGDSHGVVATVRTAEDVMAHPEGHYRCPSLAGAGRPKSKS